VLLSGPPSELLLELEQAASPAAAQAPPMNNAVRIPDPSMGRRMANPFRGREGLASGGNTIPAAGS